MSDSYSFDCPEAIQHGPTDAAGRCPWCGRKVDKTMPRPRQSALPTSDLTLAYEEFYNPDYGALSPDEVNARYLMGLYS